MEADIYQNSMIATYVCTLIDVTPVDGISVVVTSDKVVVYEDETISMEYWYNMDGVDARRYAFQKAGERVDREVSRTVDCPYPSPLTTLVSALCKNLINSITAWFEAWRK